MEIEGLKVIISAEVKAAIENMQKMQAQVQKTQDVVKKMKEKEEEALKKWKMGWVAVSTAALASLYALAKTSAYMSMWFEEATGIVQYFSDSAMEPLSPIVEEVNNILWKLADTFDKLPSPIKGAVGAILLIAGALGGILTTLVLVDKLFETTFATQFLGYLAGAKTALIAFGSSILGSIAIGIGVGITAVWILDKLGIITALDEAGRNLEKQMPTIFNLLKILTAPLAGLGAVIIDLVRGETDRIIPDLRRIFGDAIYAAFDVFPNAFKWISEQGRGFREWAGYGEKYNIAPRTYQTGTAFVPSTGLYTLHRGESVIPRGKSVSEGSTINFSPTVNITGTTINSAMDIRQLAAQLTSYWRDDLQRYSRLGVT